MTKICVLLCISVFLFGLFHRHSRRYQNCIKRWPNRGNFVLTTISFEEVADPVHILIIHPCATRKLRNCSRPSANRHISYSHDAELNPRQLFQHNSNTIPTQFQHNSNTNPTQIQHNTNTISPQIQHKFNTHPTLI